jgi:hypothetical protein
MNTVRADDEIIDLLATAPHVLEFKPSDEARARVWDLVAREKSGTLTDEEKSELDHYAQIEHLMRLVKARARKNLQQAA